MHVTNPAVQPKSQQDKDDQVPFRSGVPFPGNGLETQPSGCWELFLLVVKSIYVMYTNTKYYIYIRICICLSTYIFMYTHVFGLLRFRKYRSQDP